MIEIIENDSLKVEISTAGAELKSLYHKKKKQEYLWQGNPAWWARRAPVLFPVVGRLNDNSYTTNGKVFSLSQHGFARDKEFVVNERQNDFIVFGLQSNPDSLKIYPYPFALEIVYELIGNKLRIGYEVKNTGSQEMHFSIGAHPGFICPLHSEEKLSDYYIEFEQTETLDRHLLDGGLFNGITEKVITNQKKLNLYETLFKKDAIVFKNMKSTYLFLKSRVSDYCLKFEYSGFPYFGIWTKPGASFICLEPWCGIADNMGFKGDLKDKEGMNSLEAGKIFARCFSIEI